MRWDGSQAMVQWGLDLGIILVWGGWGRMRSEEARNIWNEQEWAGHVGTRWELNGNLVWGRNGMWQDKELLLTKAEFFYQDDPVSWPLKESHYYLGHVPKLSALLPQSSGNRLMWERMIHGIYCDWHNTSVQLTSRIFSELQRCVTHSWDEERKRCSH